MSSTLSYGVYLPSTGDSGAALFTGLEGDLTQLNDHTHNGVNSAQLSATSVVGTTQSILAAAWVASGATGHYRQSVTLPAGYSFDTVQIGFRTAAGIYIMPTVERISATQFYVYTTDNSLTFTAVYGG